MILNKYIPELISTLGRTGHVAKHLNIKPSAISNWKKLSKIPKKKTSKFIKIK